MLLPNMKPTHPGEIIREEFMVPLGLDVDTLATDLGISSDALNDIITEKAPITDELARRLALRFNTSSALWSGLQTEYFRRCNSVDGKQRLLRKKNIKSAKRHFTMTG